MNINHLEYFEFKGSDHEWSLDKLSFGDINLLVGRNATGKSRVINIIGTLGKLVSGRRKDVPIDGNFDAKFTHNNDIYHYIMKHSNSIVTHEDLFENDNAQAKLHRRGGGLGRIYGVEIGKEYKFQVPGSELAVVAKRDEIQHPFLKPLNDWGASLRHFEFAGMSGRTSLAVAIKSDINNLDETDPSHIVGLFNKGKMDFGDDYVNSIKQDMESIDYLIESISIERPKFLVVLNGPPAMENLVGLSVKEKDLLGTTDQPYISQGMFRAFSLIVHINYLIFSKTSATVLIDDIGEGLDYERSCALIGLLRAKAKSASLQLIMSTNDRFVMNAVPLEEWCVLRRNGSHVCVFNYDNSAPIFERFKRTGLSNFDLLTTDFIEKVTSNGADGHRR